MTGHALRRRRPCCSSMRSSVEQAAADGSQQRFDGFGTQIGRDDGAAGALVVAAGDAETVHHLCSISPARPPSEPARSDNLILPVEHSRGQRPVDLVEADEEVGDLGDDVRLGHRPAPTDDQLVVEERVGERVLKSGEVALRQLGIADAGQQVFVGAGKSQIRAPSSSELASRG